MCVRVFRYSINKNKKPLEITHSGLSQAALVNVLLEAPICMLEKTSATDAIRPFEKGRKSTFSQPFLNDFTIYEESRNETKKGVIFRTKTASMMNLQTDSLRMQEVELSDLDFIFELHNSPKWLQYIGDRGIHSLKDATIYIQQLHKNYRSQGYGLYKIMLKEKQIPIGLCGFIRRNFLSHPDLGFALLPQYEQQGFALEAAEAMLDYGFTGLGFETVFAITSTENLRSQHLLRKLGFKKEKIIEPEPGEIYVLYTTQKKGGSKVATAPFSNK